MAHHSEIPKPGPNRTHSLVRNEVAQFFKASTLAQRAELTSVEQVLVIRKLKECHRHFCSCETCLRNRIPYFDAEARLYDTLVSVLKASKQLAAASAPSSTAIVAGRCTKPADKEAAARREAYGCSSTFIFNRKLYIESGRIRVHQSALADDNFLQRMVDKRKALEDECARRCEGDIEDDFCELCNACINLENLVSRHIEEKVCRAYWNSLAVLKSDLMLEMLIKEEEQAKGAAAKARGKKASSSAASASSSASSAASSAKKKALLPQPPPPRLPSPPPADVDDDGEGDDDDDEDEDEDVQQQSQQSEVASLSPATSAVPAEGLAADRAAASSPQAPYSQISEPAGVDEDEYTAFFTQEPERRPEPPRQQQQRQQQLQPQQQQQQQWETVSSSKSRKSKPAAAAAMMAPSAPQQQLQAGGPAKAAAAAIAASSTTSSGRRSHREQQQQQHQQHQHQQPQPQSQEQPVQREPSGRHRRLMYQQQQQQQHQLHHHHHQHDRPPRSARTDHQPPQPQQQQQHESSTPSASSAAPASVSPVHPASPTSGGSPAAAASDGPAVLQQSSQTGVATAVASRSPPLPRAAVAVAVLPVNLVASLPVAGAPATAAFAVPAAAPAVVVPPASLAVVQQQAASLAGLSSAAQPTATMFRLVSHPLASSASFVPGFVAAPASAPVSANLFAQRVAAPATMAASAASPDYELNPAFGDIADAGMRNLSLSQIQQQQQQQQQQHSALSPAVAQPPPASLTAAAAVAPLAPSQPQRDYYYQQPPYAVQSSFHTSAFSFPTIFQSAPLLQHSRPYG